MVQTSVTEFSYTVLVKTQPGPRKTGQQCLKFYHQVEARLIILTNLKKNSMVKQLYTVVHKKQDTKLLSITLPNNDRFSKFFHCYTQQEICNKDIHYRFRHNLMALLHYRVKY